MTDTTYRPSDASLFATVARQAVTITVWCYCANCEQERKFEFVREVAREEVYRCPVCGWRVGFTVR